MIKSKGYAFISAIMVLAVMMVYTSGFSQTAFYHAPTTFKGGPDAILYNGDTVMLKNTIIEDASGIAAADSVSFGLSYLYSPYYMNAFFDLNYAPLKFLELGVSIPFLYRTLEADNGSEYKKAGYGDTAFFVRLCFRDLFNAIDSTTSLNVTAPTGDPVALDGFEVVPLGYGNVTAGIQEAVSYELPDSVTKLPIRLFASIALQYYSEVKIETNAMDRETYDYYLAFSHMIGGEYAVLPYLALQLKWNMVYLPEREYEVEDLATGDTDPRNRHDRLISSDLVFAVRYSVKNYFSGSVFGVLPLFDVKSPDAPDSVKHEWKVMACFTKNIGVPPVGGGADTERPAAPRKRRQR